MEIASVIQSGQRERDGGSGMEREGAGGREIQSRWGVGEDVTAVRSEEPAQQQPLAGTFHPCWRRKSLNPRRCVGAAQHESVLGSMIRFRGARDLQVVSIAACVELRMISDSISKRHANVSM